MNKKDKLSNDIRDWQFKDKLVIFEDFKSTLKRSEESLNIENTDYIEDDYPVKLKEISYINGSQIQPIFHPEFSEPEKHFKLWTIYTKIPLTSKILVRIENIDGIESIEVLTRYRARIGIAPLFKDGLAMQKIKNIILQSLKTDIEENVL